MEDTQEEKKKIDFFAEKKFEDIKKDAEEAASNTLKKYSGKIASFAMNNPFLLKILALFAVISLTIGVIQSVSFLIVHYYFTISVIGFLIITKELSKLKNKKRNGN